jgi:hypothetical protein
VTEGFPSIRGIAAKGAREAEKVIHPPALPSQRAAGRGRVR